jgi:hypothetical protein
MPVTFWMTTVPMDDDVRAFIRDTSAGTGGQHTTRYLPTKLADRQWRATWQHLLDSNWEEVS